MVRLGFIVLALLLAAAGAKAESVRVDDLTTFDPATGRFESGPHQRFAVRSLTLRKPHVERRAPSDGWVAFSTSNNAGPFDLLSLLPGSVVSVLPEASYPYDAAISPDGSKVWIPGAVGDGVLVIDRATGAIDARITAGVGQYLVGLTFTLDGSRVLVSSRDDRWIAVIDVATLVVLSTLRVESPPGTARSPGNLTVDPVSGRIYAVEWFGPRVFEIAADGSAHLRTASIGTSLWQLVAAPDCATLYVTDRASASNLLRVVDMATLTQIGSAVVARDPWGLDITGDGRTLVVACEDVGMVQVVDAATLAVSDVALESGADPRDVDIDDATGRAYVVGGRVGPIGSERSPVYVVDIASSTVVASVDFAAANSNVIAVQPARGQAPPCGSCGTLSLVEEVMAIKSGMTDVVVSWSDDPQATGYNVWRVDAKTDIAIARDPPTPAVTAVCLDAASPICPDPGAIPGTSAHYFYQVRSVCRGTEGP